VNNKYAPSVFHKELENDWVKTVLAGEAVFGSKTRLV